MIWTVLALALWVVLGGFISYYGDLQGRRWGKKRVSWFGMRPKHTAILITSITGGFIALFSIVSLMIIVPPVRHVLTQGERAINENKRLIADERRQQFLEKQVRDRENHENQLRLEANEKLLADGRRNLSDLQKQYGALQERVAPLQRQIAQLEAQERRDVAAKANLQQHLAALQKRHDQLYSHNTELAAANTKKSSENHKLVMANELLTGQYIQLKNDAPKLKQDNEDFYHKNVELEHANAALADAKKALEKQKSDLANDVAQLDRDRDEILRMLGQRDALSKQIAQEYTVLREGHVILRAGVELARIAVDSHLRPDAIRKQVTSLISAASGQAEKYGAAPDESGRAAYLAPQGKYTLTGYTNVPEDAQLDRLAEDWAGQDKSYVVVALAATNCLAGEPARLDLRRYPVVRVFAKGAEVASRTIDGRAKVDDIIVSLMDFLRKDVQKSAIEAGIIPRIDPDTGLPEVGVLGTADLYRLMDTVRRMHCPVVLTARAKQDVSSADTLNLRFDVARRPTQPQTLAADRVAPM